MNISEPVKVETPKQITNLEAAKIALRADGSKYAHLSPHQAALLAEYIERLETENSSLRVEHGWILGLKTGMKYVTRCYVKTLRDNAELRKHLTKLEHSVISLSRISEMQPFHLEPEK